MAGAASRSVACVGALLALAVGCRSRPEGPTLDAGGIVAARPYTLHVPARYDPSRPTPLVVMFHGYGASGALEEVYMGLTTTSDAHSFLYAYGDGTTDPRGQRFWNATDACCDHDGLPVDDVRYFDAIVADIESRYNVDRRRIFAMGHSNGGFMSHRLACDRASTVAAILSLAGAQWDDLSKCSPSSAVSVAEVHGNADRVILYEGGKIGERPYPSAPITVADWAKKNGCAGGLAATGATYDVDSQLAGRETQVQAYTGCPAGIAVELWIMQGGAHLPALTASWGELVWGFLSAHPKP
jgi:polyhydroxybutyrate depolymerase